MATKKELLFEAVSGILYSYDFAGINFGSNPDEYDSEAAAILTRLQFVRDVEALTQRVYETFVEWFGGQDVLVYEKGDPVYQKAAEEIWTAWQGYHAENKVDFWGIEKSR